ncbi:MAG: stage 0 sporulation family protein [Bacilli bacterium]
MKNKEKIVGVSFEDEEKIEYFYTNNLSLKKNITVVTKNTKGMLFGKVVTDEHNIDTASLKVELGRIIRVASKTDYLNYKNNLKDSQKSLEKIKELINKYDLKMQVIDATFTFDRSQLIFNFYSEKRVDFRDLARELATIYKTRIELRQIGVRDKSKKIGGYGSCGQQLCCSRYLNEFDTVTISMAKNQNLALNPNKINGVCGRLLCCLKYEDDTYKECKKNIPHIGKIVETKSGQGKVISVNVLKKNYTVLLLSGGTLEVNVDGCC